MTNICVLLHRREFCTSVCLAAVFCSAPAQSMGKGFAFLSSLRFSLRIIFLNSEVPLFFFFKYDLKVVTGLSKKVLYSHPCIMLMTPCRYDNTSLVLTA